jgi:hypothetical protein
MEKAPSWSEPRPVKCVSLGQVIAIAGEIYFLILALLITAMAAGVVPAGLSFIKIEDPTIAANFTA